MIERIIKYFVEKWWKYDVFQEAITERIKSDPAAWCVRNLNKFLSCRSGYLLLHDFDQMACPFIFQTEQEVRDKVTEWDKAIRDEALERTDTPVIDKPKRKYNKKKKDGNTSKENS